MRKSVAFSVAQRATILAFFAVLTLGGCNQGGSSTAADAGKLACLADSVNSLHISVSVPTCTEGALCRAKCQLGDGASCLGLAYSLEASPVAAGEVHELYQRACTLGEANACTNYAASIWVKEPLGESSACVQRMFEMACSVKEPFACGMVGRLMLESKAPLYAEGRRYLESACDQVGGFSCRVLAKHLESGKLGEYRPETIHSLLSRACESGDPDACGTHETAEETFR